MKINKVGIETCSDYSDFEIERSLNKLMIDLGLNVDNPFEEFIKPGMSVFIKPNWVASRWRASCEHEGTLYSVITHQKIIEAVADRVAKALDGKGQIIIGDNPSIDADFSELMEFTGIKKLETKYSVPLKVIDMRPLVCNDLKYYGQRDKMVRQTGDPNGEVQVNLGKDSMFYNVDSSLFRGVFNEREETIKSHTGETQLYTFGRSLYDADVYISIPKMKTHQKVGATLNLKGLVGSVTDKNQLVHWKVGSPELGGDEYPNLQAFEAAKNAKVTHRGSWPGNDTIWRMVVDLYKSMHKKRRSYFTIIDGVISGEGQGPFCPTAKYANILVAGQDLLSTDIVAAKLMGLDPTKISYLNYFLENGSMSYDAIEIKSTIYLFNKSGEEFLEAYDRYLDFKVVPQWECIKTELKR
ncbi:hypothetical protein BN3590_00095 [Clostridium sp. C105KSO15]|nr:hypothetical protein BN3590_00095 [Clostridium sp. C105KSO15]